MDPSGYLVSEKYDGVRALWDGRMLSLRSGRAVNAPAWFTAEWPTVPLDGELWLGRGRFDALSGIVRRSQPDDLAWRGVRYMAFELPRGAGRFAERAQALHDLARANPASTWRAVEQKRLADAAALQRALDEVVRGGGEGLMLHRCDAPCATGRSDTLLKLKPLADAEATVIGHVPGRGRLAGLVGALVVRSDGGHEFKLGSGLSDAQRRQPPPVGSVVTYAYRDRTPGGVPRFATFVRVRDEP